MINPNWCKKEEGKERREKERTEAVPN